MPTRANVDVMEVTAEQALAYRVMRHRLKRRGSAAELTAIVGELGGIQAQMASAAEMSIAARIDGLKVKDVREALIDSRSLIKIWTLRGTLHYIPAHDVALFGAAMRGAVADRIPVLERVYGISRADVDRLTAAIGEALDATPRTRAQLAASVEQHLPERLRHLLLSGWGSVLHPAAHAGLLCFGPAQGQNVTFVKVEAWTNRPLMAISPEAASLALARRYLHVNGPAGAADFARWSGLSLARAKGAFESIASDLEQVVVAGRKAVILKQDATTLASAGFDGEVRLLPHFDVYTLAQAGRDLMISAEHRSAVYRKSGWISPVIVAEGRIAGTWTLTRGKISLEPFRRLDAVTRRAAKADGERLLGAL
ncbi:MAG: winged helix DNA-binding domain-containing protein [Candidatus Dormibacterales bacterium]